MCYYQSHNNFCDYLLNWLPMLIAVLFSHFLD